MHSFTAQLWLYPGDHGSWHFFTLPKALSQELTDTYGAQRRGWKSLPVRVTVNDVSWDTSIFFDRRENAYLLPVKAAVRKQAHLGAKMMATVALRVRLE